VRDWRNAVTKEVSLQKETRKETKEKKRKEEKESLLTSSPIPSSSFPTTSKCLRT